MDDHPVHGRRFGELTAGDEIRHALTRTITETDNVLMSALTMNPARIHLDAAYAATTEFGTPIVNSILTLGLVIGISVLETTHGTAVANLSIDEAVFPAPVRAGDTISVETTVIEARPSRSRPGAGVVTFEHRGANQDGALVCRVRRTALVAGQP